MDSENAKTSDPVDAVVMLRCPFCGGEPFGFREIV